MTTHTKSYKRGRDGLKMRDSKTIVAQPKKQGLDKVKTILIVI